MVYAYIIRSKKDKKWYNGTTADLRKRQRRFLSLRGQALLELAIFGSIMIMLLGVILNYGLRYSYDQKTQMEAFRRALNETVSSHQSSVVVIRDGHIPNPSHPFAIGLVAPFFSSANIVRSYRMHHTADRVSELPKITVQIQDKQFSYKIAGFRDESNVHNQTIEKYNEIYGVLNVCSDPSLGCGAILGECASWGSQIPTQEKRSA
jgi:hypothetical protein